MREGLLNPPVEANVCRQMIKAIEADLALVEKELTTVVMDRERYLQKMGRIDQARKSLGDLKRIYQREFEV